MKTEFIKKNKQKIILHIDYSITCCFAILQIRDMSSDNMFIDDVIFECIERSSFKLKIYGERVGSCRDTTFEMIYLTRLIAIL